MSAVAMFTLVTTTAGNAAQCAEVEVSDSHAVIITPLGVPFITRAMEITIDFLDGIKRQLTATAAADPDAIPTAADFPCVVFTEAPGFAIVQAVLALDRVVQHFVDGGGEPEATLIAARAALFAVLFL
jgi:hypothetical protein